MTRLRELREARGLSLRKLATMADVHYVSLARLEAGLLDPRLSTLLKLCRVLGVTLTELVGKGPFHKGGKSNGTHKAKGQLLRRVSYY